MEALLLLLILILLMVQFPDAVAAIIVAIPVLLIMALIGGGILWIFSHLIPERKEPVYPVVDHKRRRIVLKGNDFGGEVLEKDQEEELVVNSYGMQSGFTMMGGVRNVMMRVGTRPVQPEEEALYLEHFPASA